MRFNILLYVPALADDLSVEYGVFIQHHLMDDADIELDYFELSQINPENYALDIVDTKEVTKKLRKDCLVEGFTLNSYYSIDRDKNYNRNIHKDDVRQIFICFKSNSKENTDAFIRVTEDQKIEDYHVSNNLIFFRLWASPEMEGISTIPLNIGKINYSDFGYFRGIIKQEVHHQWHSFLQQKRAISKAALAEHKKAVDAVLPVNEAPVSSPKLSNIFVPEYEDTPHSIAADTDTAPQERGMAQSNDSATDNYIAVVDNNQGSQTFRIIAYILLTLGIVSILGKLFGTD